MKKSTFILSITAFLLSNSVLAGQKSDISIDVQAELSQIIERNLQEISLPKVSLPLTVSHTANKQENEADKLIASLHKEVNQQLKESLGE